MNKTAGLIIFTKYPEYGKVKTRLAATIGNGKAMKFYKTCAEHLFDSALALNDSVEIFLFYSPEKDFAKIKKWIARDFSYIPQTDNDLGLRMADAFENLFDNNFRKVVIVGTDIPDVNAELLIHAFRALDNNDIVIGPAYDGGYYLLGMKKFFPALFQGIEWSTNKVFDLTVEKAKKAGLKVEIIKKLHDIDTEMELLNWLKSKDGDANFKEQLRKAVFG